MIIKLSTYQEAILKAISNRIIENNSKGIIIEALAGCGKSYTLKLIAERLAELEVKGSECRFVVFGRKNKADLQSKLSAIGKPWGDSVKTLNSLGYEILRDALGRRHNSFNIDRDKYARIAQEFNYVDSVNRLGGKIKGSLTTPIGTSDESIIKSEGTLIDLIDKLRGDCVEEITENNIKKTIDRYGLEIKNHHIGEIAKAVKHIIEIGHQRALEKLHIDFCDQSWILYLERETPVFKRAFERFKDALKFIAIDEAQDTDRLQIEMIKLLHGDNNFVCPVGDKWQAVYFFRGCLSDGMEQMKESFNCESFDLPINFRCGKKHLELVREIYPKIQIQPHDNAPDGEIICIKESDFISSIGDYHNLSHFAICRKNAPLLTFAIRCLTNEIPARIKDKQLAGKIVYRVEQVCKKHYDKTLFLMQLDQWRTESLLSLDKLPERIQEIKKQEITDYSECMTALFEKFQPASIKEWRTCIESICDEEKNGNFVDFFSIHSGKGGEGDRSFVIYPHLQPVDFKGQSSEEYQQEKNMIYVALTRTLAKHPNGGKLFLVLQERENGGVYWPSWLPNEYRNLEGEEEAIPLEQPDFLNVEPRLLESEQWSDEIFDGSDADTDDQWQCDNCGWWMTQNYDDCYHCGEKREDYSISPLEQLKLDIREYFTNAKAPDINKAIDGVIQVASGTDGRGDIEWRLKKYFSPKHREAVREFANRYCDIIEQQWEEELKAKSAAAKLANEEENEYRDWAGLPRRIDENKTAVEQAIATNENAETIDNSLEVTSIEENCHQSQLHFNPIDQFNLGLKVGLSIPLEQLSNEEKRERAIAAIKSNPEMSARAIADEIGVSNYFVSKLKKSLINNGEILPTQVKDKRGRILNTENIGASKKTSIKDKVKALIYEEKPTEDEIAELIEMLKNL